MFNMLTLSLPVNIPLGIVWIGSQTPCVAVCTSMSTQCAALATYHCKYNDKLLHGSEVWLGQGMPVTQSCLRSSKGKVQLI